MRRVLAIMAVVAALATPVLANSIDRATSHDEARLTPNGQRFLQLSSGDRAGGATGTTVLASTTAAPVDAGAGRPTCGPAPTTPAGWCLTPAGNQYDVLRFPIGL